MAFLYLGVLVSIALLFDLRRLSIKQLNETNDLYKQIWRIEDFLNKKFPEVEEEEFKEMLTSLNKDSSEDK